MIIDCFSLAEMQRCNMFFLRWLITVARQERVRRQERFFLHLTGQERFFITPNRTVKTEKPPGKTVGPIPVQVTFLAPSLNVGRSGRRFLCTEGKSMYIAECSALAAALCWSFGGLLSTTPTRAFGAVRFNRIRLSIVSLILFVFVFMTGSWRTLGLHSVWGLALSAMIGIFLGDTLLYATLKRLGPRRTGILFTTNAPITVIIGYFFLKEALPFATAIGCILIMAGVLLAIFCRTSSSRVILLKKSRAPSP